MAVIYKVCDTQAELDQVKTLTVALLGIFGLPAPPDGFYQVRFDLGQIALAVDNGSVVACCSFLVREKDESFEAYSVCGGIDTSHKGTIGTPYMNYVRDVMRSKGATTVELLIPASDSTTRSILTGRGNVYRDNTTGLADIELARYTLNL